MEPYSQEDVDIQDSGMVNVEKKTGLKDLDGDDSTSEESISHSEAYHTESGENDESSEETATKVVKRRMKRKQVDCHVFDGDGVLHNQSIEGAQSKGSSKSPMGKKILFLFCLQLM